MSFFPNLCHEANMKLLNKIVGKNFFKPLCQVRQKYEQHSPDDWSEHTHFGFETVKKNEKSKKVYEVFENVANQYDQMNDAMSLGLHRIWKDIFMQRLSPNPGTNLLDVAGGTGDIAFRFLKYIRLSSVGTENIIEGNVTVCDINESMLETGKARANSLGISDNIQWEQGDAENLPFKDSSFSAYTIAFGIRNCTNIDKVIDEAYRVLRPGGRFLCLEFSHVHNDLLRRIYDEYSFQVIPVMGQIIAGQWKPYQYLVESIRNFPNQEEFKHLIESAGFRVVSYENLTFGIVAIHSGFKI